MQAVQRRFGKLLPRTADESQVAVLLKDFDDADRLLARIAEGIKAWRDAWKDILSTQQRLAKGYATLYLPIIGADNDYEGHVPLETPDNLMSRTQKLSQLYDELRESMLEEVNMVDTRIIKPAIDAKECIQPMKKVIKRRGDRKLDFERYQQRVDVARKKSKRSDRDNISLEKAEQELSRAKEEYLIADDNLKSSLPPVITSAFSILPHLLANQIMIQNTLLAQYYTILHNFSTEEAFPSPPSSTIDIKSSWEAQFLTVRQHIESEIRCVSGGKAVKQAFHGFGEMSTKGEGRPGVPPQRKSSSNLLAAPPSPATQASPLSSSPGPATSTGGQLTPQTTSLSLSMPNYNTTANASPLSLEGVLHAPAGPRADYFTRDRQPSSSSIASAKKKPPPPPPPKRLHSAASIFVTAIYDFEGQSDGDLTFREGDQIKIVKKTSSNNDWWQGELRGIQGAFPANYCQSVS